jgi:hypothetical protein
MIGRRVVSKALERDVPLQLSRGFNLSSLVFRSQFRRATSSLPMEWMLSYHVSRIISLNNSRSVVLEYQMAQLDDDCFARPHNRCPSEEFC